MKTRTNSTNLLARVILAGLACYRLAALVTADDGPPIPLDSNNAGMFLRLRLWFAEYGETPKKFIECPYCVGAWIALALSVLVMLPTLIGDLLLVWFAIAGTQDALQTIADNKRE